MTSFIKHPTSDAELNWVLRELVTSMQAILGGNFIGAYLQGSFALGDWDNFSDVDFIVAIEREITQAELDALQLMHARIYQLESRWAMHLEGSYFPREILRCAGPARKPLYYLDNTASQLIRSEHCNMLVVRWIAREHGITLAGPPAHTLIDPVLPEELTQEVLAIMQDWARQISDDPESINNRFYQPYAVLSYCRMLYTQATGTVGSKPTAAQWAMINLDERWCDLIQRAMEERAYPSLRVRQPADEGDLKRTLEIITYALDASRKYV